MTALIHSNSQLRRSSLFSLRALVAALSLVLLPLSLAACGANGSTTSSRTSASGKAAITTPVDTRPLHATLAGENHAPKVNQPWSYSVTVTDALGHLMSGTVNIEFALSGQVVGHDKPPTDRVNDGHMNDTIKFPAEAVGVPLDVRAVVHTTLGSLTRDWPITVQR
jgi:hypothetical protein